MDTRTPSTRPAETQRLKSILICPECGHESPPDGDWQTRHSGESVVLVCPACEMDVVRRPTAPLDTPASAVTPAVPVAPKMLSSTADLLSAMWRNYTHQVTGWIRS